MIAMIHIAVAVAVLAVAIAVAMDDADVAAVFHPIFEAVQTAAAAARRMVADVVHPDAAAAAVFAAVEAVQLNLRRKSFDLAMKEMIHAFAHDL